MFSVARSRAYDPLPGPIIPAQTAMGPENPGFAFFALPPEIQDSVLLKLIFDIIPLARFRMTCRAANTLVSDFQNRVAKFIGCPEYPHSTLPRPIQVLHFVDRVRSSCSVLWKDNEPSVDAIVVSQKNLTAKRTDRKLSGIVQELKENFENLDYVWPEAPELAKWGGKKHQYY